MTELKQPDYVIRYDGVPKSYFSRWTGIGPAFGAKLKDTPRYGSEDDARQVIRQMPVFAGAMCEIKSVAPLKRRK